MSGVPDRRGSSPRPPVRDPRAGPLVAAVTGALLLGAVLVVACSPASTSRPSPSPATASPTTSAPAGETAPDRPAPSPTNWPGSIVEGVVALGVADNEIQKAGIDLQAAADAEDLEKMWGAADGLAKLLVTLSLNVDRIADYPATSDVAAAYRRAFPDMLAGAEKVRDSITNGDAAGLTAGSEQLARGLRAYGEVRILLGPLTEQALLMKRMLLQ